MCSKVNVVLCRFFVYLKQDCVNFLKETFFSSLPTIQAEWLLVESIYESDDVITARHICRSERATTQQALNTFVLVLMCDH